MKLPELADLVRTQVALVAEPGPASGAVVERIVRASKEYAQSVVGSEIPLLASAPPRAAPDAPRDLPGPQEISKGLAEVRNSLKEVFVKIQMSRAALG